MLTCASLLEHPRSPDEPRSRRPLRVARVPLTNRARGASTSRQDAGTPPEPCENLVVCSGALAPHAPPVRLEPLFWRMNNGSEVWRGWPVLGSGWVTSPVAIIMQP